MNINGLNLENDAWCMETTIVITYNDDLSRHIWKIGQNFFDTKIGHWSCLRPLQRNTVLIFIYETFFMAFS